MAGVLVVAAVVLGLGTPAGAKGPAGVTIQPPGGEPEALPTATATEPGVGDGRLLALADDLGLWQALDSRLAPAADQPADPGPGFRVEWSLAGPDGEAPFVQTLHPQAPGGPLVHTETGVLAYGQPVAGGWFRASPRLADTLASLGRAMKTTVPGGAADGPRGGAASGGAGARAEGRGPASGTAGSATGAGAVHERWPGRAAVAGVALVVVSVAARVRAVRRRRPPARLRDAVPTSG